jgi:uncharacterized protein (DUF2267 family)
MSQTGMSEFDTTVQEANVWLNEIAGAMGHPDKRVAYHALRGVLHALRDRLPVDEVFDLSAQLPTLIRGIFLESYRPAGKPEKLTKDQFIARVAAELKTVGGENPAHAAGAVFSTLDRHVTRGELDQVRGILPAEFRELWPEHAGSAR